MKTTAKQKAYFGKMLKKYRLEKGISQTELANRVGTGPNSISYYERGRVYPHFYTIKKISNVLNISHCALLQQTDNEPEIVADLKKKLKALDSYLYSSENIVNEIIDNLKCLRRLRLITVKDMATSIGCSQNFLELMESKNRKSSLRALINLSKGLGVTIPFISALLNNIKGTKRITRRKKK